MILGIGVDIEDNIKFRDSLVSNGTRFLTNIFTDDELQDLNAEHLCGLFCAKEALMKAFGGQLVYKEIEIKADQNGRPYANPCGYTSGKLLELGVKKIFVSISHTMQYSTAVVVLDG